MLGDVLSLYNVFFLAAKGPAVVEHKVDTKVARPCMTMHGKKHQIPLAINPYWFYQMLTTGAYTTSVLIPHK